MKPVRILVAAGMVLTASAIPAAAQTAEPSQPPEPAIDVALEPVTVALDCASELAYQPSPHPGGTPTSVSLTVACTDPASGETIVEARAEIHPGALPSQPQNE